MPSDLAVYIHERGKKPRKTDKTISRDAKPPGTIEIDGKTYAWVAADYIAKTITYTDMVSSGRTN